MKIKDMTTLHLRKSIGRSPWRRGYLLIAVALCCLGLAPAVQAVSPPPDGGYPNQNTAEGNNALFSLTTGIDNTAIGFHALFNNTTGNENTATGAEALFNSTASFDTANGFQALHHNLTGFHNTATGWRALFENTIGFQNTAIGAGALVENSTGIDNTAVGAAALNQNETGRFNTATGFQALPQNTTGSLNTAIGNDSLFNNTTGNNNTAIGFDALHQNTTGSRNIALGGGAGGTFVTTGDDNIDIGAGNGGVSGESSTIRIGQLGSHLDTYIAGIFGTNIVGLPVAVTSDGHLGVAAASSARFKDAIKPMDKASEAILALKPVTFYYKKQIDPKRTAQFGLVAEEVEKVNPDLVTRDGKGELYTVRYEAVNAMLLNEFLKEHCKMQEQEAAISQLNSTVAKQDATIAQQQKGMEAVAARLNEQAAQIQKVTAQLEASKPAPQVVNYP
jgi:uncharacterized coiled-coil protein SlyX